MTTATNHGKTQAPRITILYFSGTGNTAHVARYLAQKLAPAAGSIELCPIEQHPAGTLADFDLLLVGFPVYACRAPGLLQDYVAQLAFGRGRGAFVFCTKGAMAGNAHRRLLQQLAQRGYVPLGGDSIAMPGSDGLAMVEPDSWLARAAQNKDFDRLATADRLATRISGTLARLAAGEPIARLRQPAHNRLIGHLIDPLWAASYRALENWMRSALHADDHCAVCGLCVQICPAGAVTMETDGPHFGEDCLLCLRCLHQCPQQAIQIGRWTRDKFRWRGPKGAYRPPRLRPVASRPESATIEAK